MISETNKFFIFSAGNWSNFIKKNLTYIKPLKLTPRLFLSDNFIFEFNSNLK